MRDYRIRYLPPAPPQCGSHGQLNGHPSGQLNVYEGNLIEHAVQEGEDAGAFYGVGNEYALVNLGNAIRNNTFRHIAGELRMTTDDIIPVSLFAAAAPEGDDASEADIRLPCSLWVYTLIPLMCKKDSHIDPPASTSSCSASRCSGL